MVPIPACPSLLCYRSEESEIELRHKGDLGLKEMSTRCELDILMPFNKISFVLRNFTMHPSFEKETLLSPLITDKNHTKKVESQIINQVNIINFYKIRETNLYFFHDGSLAFVTKSNGSTIMSLKRVKVFRLSSQMFRLDTVNVSGLILPHLRFNLR